MAHANNDWQEWLGRHGPALVLYARQWLRSSADAEDAVQDGFVRFWQSRARARHGVAYLYASVRSAAMDLARARHRREQREAAAAELRGASTGLFAAMDPEFAEAVESSLARLPVEQREVVVLKIWGGLTFAEIGQATGISPNTAASRYRYALERLQDELSEEMAHD